jgi:hypothetical protein
VGFALGGEVVIKEGFLHKAKEKGTSFTGKKKRYCVLDDYTCRYYDRKGGALKGQLELIGLKVASVLDKGGKVVAIKLNCADGSAYLFTMAVDGDSMESWLAAVRKKFFFRFLLIVPRSSRALRSS